MKPLIALRNVSVAYDGIPVLTNVNLEVRSDDFIGIIGPNGGGKTTLLKALLQLIPYKGEIIFGDGMTVGDGSIGYLPQQTNFDRSFPITLEEVVTSGLQSGRKLLWKINRSERSKVRELMETAGILSIAGSPIGEVSGGEMQKALLCRAIISDPKLLILDEPTNFVDNKFEEELYAMLSQLSERMAIMMVSHDVGIITPYIKDIVTVNRTVQRQHILPLTQFASDH